MRTCFFIAAVIFGVLADASIEGGGGLLQTYGLICAAATSAMLGFLMRRD